MMASTFPNGPPFLPLLVVSIPFIAGMPVVGLAGMLASTPVVCFPGRATRGPTGTGGSAGLDGVPGKDSGAPGVGCCDCSTRLGGAVGRVSCGGVCTCSIRLGGGDGRASCGGVCGVCCDGGACCCCSAGRPSCC